MSPQTPQRPRRARVQRLREGQWRRAGESETSSRTGTREQRRRYRQAQRRARKRLGDRYQQTGRIVEKSQKHIEKHADKQEQKDDVKITKITAALMITAAGIIDLLQFLVGLLHVIPGVGNIIALVINFLITAVAWVIFYIWFAINGVRFMSSRRIYYFGGGIFLELIPILKMLPGWTLAVVLVILSTKAKKISSVPLSKKSAIRRARRIA